MFEYLLTLMIVVPLFAILYELRNITNQLKRIANNLEQKGGGSDER